MSIKLDNISKNYAVRSRDNREAGVLKEVNLEVFDGELVTLLGPSGCGKTTTLRIIAGFETPSSGEIRIRGRLVNHIPPDRRGISLVFQSYALFPHLTVSRNIGFGLKLKGWGRGQIEDEVGRIAEIMNIKHLLHRRPDQLSGGEQQRVALARAIVNKPHVLLCDEPLSNLDTKLREQLRDEIRRVQQTLGMTTLYVTHDQAEAMTISDRIAVMHEGRIVQIGNPFRIYSRPADRFVAEFIGKVNLIKGKICAKHGRSVTVHYGTGIRELDTNDTGLNTGQEIITVVRPESIRLHLPGQPSACPGHSPHHKPLFQGTITRILYAGAVVEYTIRTKKHGLLNASVSNPVEAVPLQRGETVEIAFDSRAAHLLPVL